MSRGVADVEVDWQSWQNTVDRFAALTDKSHYEVLTQQSTLFVRDVLRLTAPLVNYGAPGESLAAQRRAGLNATARDIGRIFTPLEDLSLWNAGDPHLRKEFRKYAAAGDLPAVKTILQLAAGINPEQVKDGAAIAAVHQSQRDRRGRVRQHVAHFFALKKPLAAYVKQRQQRVGLLKAGWAAAAERFGVALTEWINRQPVRGTVDVQFTRNNPFVRMVNTVRYAGDAWGEESVREAFRRREQAMTRQIRAALSGDWKKSGRKAA